MKEKRTWLYSALVSFFLHGIILAWSFFIWMPGANGTPLKAVKIFRVGKSVDYAKPRPLNPGGSAGKTTGQAFSAEQLKFQNPSRNIPGLLKTAPAFSQINNPPAELALGSPLEITGSEPDSAMPEMPSEKAVLESLKGKITIARREIPKSGPQPSSILFLEGEEDLNAEASAIRIPKEFINAMPAFTPSKISEDQPLPGQETGIADPLPASNPAAQGSSPVSDFQHEAGRESLEPFLNTLIVTYRDPEDGQGYFQIQIHPSNQAEHLEVMPKEIIFLVDASLSINTRRLFAFKEGIRHALGNLNPGDRFNIYVFKDKIIPFALDSVPPDPHYLTNAAGFLERIRPTKATNIYSAFGDSIQKPAMMHPSYIFLLSDGRPTRGEVSSARLISEITRKNNLSRPVFTFGGGPLVNRFLLDFLAYTNRGWSEYAHLNSEIEERLSEFTDKIRNPVLTKIRYQLTPFDESEAFPKSLPDLYRDAVFMLHGKFTDEKEFSMRLLGEIAGKTKELIFSGRLPDEPTGTRDVARFWAFSKAYHLIGEMVVKGPDPKAILEINRLARKFSLELPYDIQEIT